MDKKTKKCPYCEWDCPADKLEEHKKVCPERPAEKKRIKKDLIKRYKLGINSIIVYVISVIAIFVFLESEIMLTILSVIIFVSWLFVRINAAIIAHELNKTGWMIFVIVGGLIPVIIFYVIYNKKIVENET